MIQQNQLLLLVDEESIIFCNGLVGVRTFSSLTLFSASLFDDKVPRIIKNVTIEVQSNIYIFFTFKIVTFR